MVTKQVHLKNPAVMEIFSKSTYIPESHNTYKGLIPANLQRLGSFKIIFKKGCGTYHLDTLLIVFLQNREIESSLNVHIRVGAACKRSLLLLRLPQRTSSIYELLRILGAP